MGLIMEKTLDNGMKCEYWKIKNYILCENHVDLFFDLYLNKAWYESKKDASGYIHQITFFKETFPSFLHDISELEVAGKNIKKMLYELAAITDFFDSATNSLEPCLILKQESDFLKLNTASYDFGEIDVDADSDEIVFTIKNVGDSDLILSGSPFITKSGTDSAMVTVTQPDSAIITARSNKTFSVIFSPTGEGVKIATIIITSNDNKKSPVVVEITGTGVIT